MIIYSVLASLALGQVATVHPLGVTVIDPPSYDFYNNPVGLIDCETPRNVQISYNRGAFTSGSLAVWLQSGATCNVTALPTDTLFTANLANLTTPDYFPRTSGDTPFTTKTVMDFGKFCDAATAPVNLTDYVLCVGISVTGQTGNPQTDLLNFRVDTKPPNAVTGLAVGSGNGRLTVSYTEDTSDGSLLNTATLPAKYYVDVFDAAADPETDAPLQTVDFAVGAGGGSIDGLENGKRYKLRVWVVDIAGNTSPYSDFVEGSPVLTCDFWSCYEGREKGGFCFIATAAYGSYDAPVVQTFRGFRDQVLLKSGPGRSFVRWYYKNGVAPARFIAERPWARSVAAAALLGPYVLIWPIVHLRAEVWACLGLALLALAALLTRRSVRGVSAVLLLLLSAQTASAEELLVREDAMDPSSVKMVPPRFEFAIKAGPYYPAIDSDADSGNFYTIYFGQGDANRGILSGGSRLRAELAADVYVFNTFGLLGFSGAAGFFEAVGFAKVCANGSCDPGQIATAPKSNDSTVLNLFPTSLSVVYKFDVLWRRWKVPLVPFVRAGIDAVFWNVQAARQQARRPDVAKYEFTLNPNGYAQGATWGWHVNPGIMIALDWIEPNAARSAYTFTGMKGSYLTFEWMFVNVDDFGSSKSWDLSSSTFQAGVAVEF